MTDSVEVFPLTITVPQSFNSVGIIEIADPYASMRAVFIERDSIHNIPEIWRNSCGFYILFSRIKPNGTYSVYVGKSDRDFTKRLRSHDMNKDVWATALMVQRNSIENLSSTQSSYLEGALRDIFDAASHVRCHNIANTGDRTLPVHERLIMKQVIESTLRIMLIRGFRTTLPVKPETLIQSTSSTLSGVMPAPQITMSVPSVEVITPTMPLLASSPQAAPPLPAPVKISLTRRFPSLPPPDRKPSVFSVFRKQDSQTSPLPEIPEPEIVPKFQTSPNTEEVFQALRAWRLVKAREERLSPAYIFDDKVLRALAEQMPANYDALLTIPGIAHTKREKYGSSIMEILDRYRLRALM